MTTPIPILSFRVAEVEGGLIVEEQLENVYHKFIIAKELSGLALYSARAQEDSPKHEAIAERYSLSEVLGGGDIYVLPERKTHLRFTCKSSDYGTVPNEILRRFSETELLVAFQKVFPTIRELEFDMWDGNKISYQWENFLQRK